MIGQIAVSAPTTEELDEVAALQLCRRVRDPTRTGAFITARWEGAAILAMTCLPGCPGRRRFQMAGNLSTRYAEDQESPRESSTSFAMVFMLRAVPVPPAGITSLEEPIPKL